jgi:hypothetical protein
MLLNCLTRRFQPTQYSRAAEAQRSVKNMKKRQNDFDDEDILDIVDEALKEAYINTDERLIIWPNGERLTVDQSAKKIIGDNDLNNEVVKDCIMAWVEMDAQPENKNKKQEELFVEEIQNWVNDYYSEKGGVKIDFT